MFVNHLHAFPHAGEAESIVLTRFFRDEVYDVTIPIHDSGGKIIATVVGSGGRASSALHRFARVRRRDGASRWGVYRDTENPANYIETFIVESWAEHLRQHERLTGADRELEENVGRFESKPVKVRHFIYARSKRGRQ